MCQTKINLTPCYIKHTSRSGSKVARLSICRSIRWIRKTVHQMWHNHPFSQRNNTTEGAVGLSWGLEATGKGGGGWQSSKRVGWGGGRQYRGKVEPCSLTTYVSISIKFLKNKRFKHWTIHQILQYMIYQWNIWDLCDRVL